MMMAWLRSSGFIHSVSLCAQLFLYLSLSFKCGPDEIPVWTGLSPELTHMCKRTADSNFIFQNANESNGKCNLVSWVDLRRAPYIHIGIWYQYRIRSVPHLVSFISWCAVDTITVDSRADDNEDEEKERQILNYGFCGAMAVLLLMEVMQSQSRSGGWCEHLNRKRFHPKFQAVNGILLTTYVSASTRVCQDTPGKLVM